MNLPAQRTGAIHRVRKLTRLRQFDYSRPGAYFVTVCVQGRECLLGEIRNDEMQLNDRGHIVEAAWRELPARYPSVHIDQFVVMPNHIHGIVVLGEGCGVGAPFMAPMHPPAMGAMNRAPTLGEVVRTIKAVSTRRIRQGGLEHFSWQRNYYEHIIRNENELTSVRTYIANNPLQWALDRENPRATRGMNDQHYTQIFGDVLP